MPLVPAKKKRNRRKKHGATLPARFEPGFLDKADGRCQIVKTIKHRLERLKADCNADSFQKQILCERAVFLATLLQTQELAAYEGEELNLGSYVQAINSLLGVLKALGLTKQISQIIDLKEYVEARA